MEYIITVNDKPIHENPRIYMCKEIPWTTFDEDELEKLKKITETEDYERGLRDAWDIVRDIMHLPLDEQYELTGNITLEEWFSTVSPLEADKKLQALKNRIKVGDVLAVTGPAGEDTCICTCVGERTITVIYSDGTTQNLIPGAESVHKKGKRFPELARMLEEIEDD